MNSKQHKTRKNFRLGYGSAWHLLRLMGYHRAYFSRFICDEINADEILWSDFVPGLQEDRYEGDRYIRERELVRLEFLPADHPLQEKYAEVWPETKKTSAQQNWDAVGKVRFGETWEWLLVEAKANLEEVKNDGCKANWEPSKKLIGSSLDATRDRMGIDKSKVWFDSYYQYANRLVTIDFLNRNDQPARMLFLYFCGDHGGEKRTCPETSSQWETRISTVHDTLGLVGNSANLAERMHEIFFDLDTTNWHQSGPKG